MNAEQLYKSGKLKEAVAVLGAQLRENPTDMRARTFLFELLCFAGEYDRAQKQLNVLEQEGNQDSMFATLLYQAALHAEKTRQEMFASKTYPKQAANEAGTGVKGKLNGKTFQSLTDGDARLGEKLEVFAGGDYMWIAYRDIATLSMEPPKRLRDLLWTPAKLQTGPSFQSQDLGEVFLPVIYPLSWQDSDDNVRLGRVTEWMEDPAGGISPFGQKILLVDGEEIPFLEIRSLEIYPVSASPPASEG